MIVVEHVVLEELEELEKLVDLDVFGEVVEHAVLIVLEDFFGKVGNFFYFVSIVFEYSVDVESYCIFEQENQLDCENDSDILALVVQYSVELEDRNDIAYLEIEDFVAKGNNDVDFPDKRTGIVDQDDMDFVAPVASFVEQTDQSFLENFGDFVYHDDIGRNSGIVLHMVQ